MILTATVTAIETASGRSDGLQRATLKFPVAELGFKTIIVPNTEGWALDTELEVVISPRVRDVSEVPFLADEVEQVHVNSNKESND